MKTLLKLLTVLCFVFAFSLAKGQSCKAFTKKNALFYLKPYISNGQMYAAKYFPGDTAEIEFVFNEGYKYRIVASTHDILGKPIIRILDKNKKVVFEKEADDDSQVIIWDFIAKKTHPLIIQLIIPNVESPDQIMASGCVAVLVGFLQQ
jgi:hypothetical protein